MAFGLPNTAAATGPFLGRLQYDSSQGHWTIVHRAQQPDGRWGDEKKRPFYEPLPSFLIDFGSIEVGYLKFFPAPEFRTVPYGQELPPAPDEMGADQNGRISKSFRPGIRAKIASPKLFGNHEAYWFSNVARGVLDAIDAMYEQFLAAPEAAQGKVPVLTCTAITETKINRNTIYTPVFAITRWMERIEAFGERTVPAPSRQARTSMGVTMPPSGPSPKPAPVAAKPAPVQPEPPPNEDDEWGSAPAYTGGSRAVPLPAGDISDDVPF